MKLEYYIPSPLLSSYIKRYAYYSIARNEEIKSIKFLPMGYSYLVFNLKDPFSIDHPKIKGRVRTQGSILVGQQDYYYHLIPEGDLTCFSIIFQPTGMYRLLHVPMHELRCYGYPAELVLKRKLDRIYDKLHYLQDDRKKMSKMVNDFFLHQLLLADNHYQYIDHVIDYIHKSKGLTDIHELSWIANVSERTFRRRFLEIVGTSCKKYIMITRLDQIMNSLKYGFPLYVNMTRIAHGFGFYDQMHFIKSFKKFSGETPTAYLSRYNNPGNILERYFLAVIE